MRSDRSPEQRLIDIMFEIAQVSATYFGCSDGRQYRSEKREEHMQWVADQLRENGFDTEPRGLSWGVLKSNPS